MILKLSLSFDVHSFANSNFRFAGGSGCGRRLVVQCCDGGIIVQSTDLYIGFSLRILFIVIIAVNSIRFL